MASLSLGGILTELGWEPWVVSELLSKVSKCSRRVSFAGQCEHPPRISATRAPPHLASLCPCLPQVIMTVSQHRKPRFFSNHICSNKEQGKDEVYKKGNTPADCHRRNFISILELMWWWILHGFPSHSEYINTPNFSSLCSKNMSSSFALNFRFFCSNCFAFWSHYFLHPYWSKWLLLQKRALFVTEGDKAVTWECICTCHHLTFILNTETRVFQY